jgi:hypothetical protein
MTDDKVKLGVLWKHVSRKGSKPYLSGRVQEDTLEAAVTLLRQGGRLLVLSSLNKRPDKQDPDCELFVTPARDGSGAEASAVGGKGGESTMKRPGVTERHR